MTQISRGRRTVALAGAAVLTLSLAACSGDDGDAALASDESGTTTVRVTTLGLCNEAIAWGIDQDIFADHGVDIELVTVQSGAAGIAALQAGETDVAFVNSLSALQAVDQGVPLRVVSGSGLSTEGANGVVVAADSDVESAADLQGTQIAINQLGGLGQVVTEAWIARDAGAPSTAEFVTLPFADQVPAVANGSVDAAQVTATQVQAGVEDGSVRSLGNPFYDGIGPIETALYMSTADVVDASEDALADFAEAMTVAAESANDEANDTERFEAMAEFCESDPEALAATPEPDYQGRLDMEQFEVLVSILEDQGQVGDVDVDELVPDFARAD